MGKRQRTPHFITGIGDGDVHDGTGNKINERDVSRLRGNKYKYNNENDSTTDNDNNSRNNGHNSRHHEKSRHNLYHHGNPNHIATRNELLHRIEENDAGGAAVADPTDSWRDSFHDQKTAIPVMDLNLDIGNINDIRVGVGDMTNPVDSSGPWQVSAFAFLGVIVVIAIFLHFVAETSSGASTNNKNGNIPKDSSSKNRHHSGTNSRPYQYRRRQRQRRMQKLRKKKTDEWSDDEEPVQNGAGLLSMSNNVLFSFATNGTGNSSSEYPDDYDHDYECENEYDYQNKSVYHQSDYHHEPNSYLSSQDISLRRTSASRDSYDYYANNSQSPAVGIVPTYKSPAASKYLMESTTTSAKTSALVFRSTATTTPQRGISPMNSYSSAGSSSRQRQRQNKSSNHSSNDSVSSPIWAMDKKINHNNNSSNNNRDNQGKNNNNGGTAATPSLSSNQTLNSGRLRMPSTPEKYAIGSALSWQHENDDMNNFQDYSAPSMLQRQSLLVPAEHNRRNELGARLLDSGSRFSSFASIVDVEVEGSQGSSSKLEDIEKKGVEKEELEFIDDPETIETWSRASGGGYGEIEIFDASSIRSVSSHHSHNSNHNNESPSVSIYEGSSVHSQRQQEIHQKTLLLTPGNCEETPVIGNARKTIAFRDSMDSSFDKAALLPISGRSGTNDSDQESFAIPYVPHLKKGSDIDTGLSPVLFSMDPPPRSVIMDELRLVEMETGNSTHWNIENSESSNYEENSSFVGDYDYGHPDTSTAKSETGELESSSHGSASYSGSDISIPSGDPRKSIVHKRRDLTMATDAATSLQSSIDFDELQLQEVIGGGGFGQVWKATWRGTPVAVKVLTGSAQNTHIAKAILEEFKAEINLLKGMRHPNICLYMGACVTPPNRAIITELAANGSAWDSLRLPLMPPYTAADGTPRGCWPMSLYLPGQHGIPPSSNGSSLSSEKISAPIPPRGTWPWELVKRVSCGAARGMAYLHSGNPPVLHRDLKSANLLLDDSYTTKVCDFGLSRLKAQARSMTANCGTVQWMAPEVLANRSYDEKADVYSFGIIVWELLSRECPYEGMTAIQCALAVLNRDKRPEIPKWCPPGLHALIKSCIKKDPSERPTFAEVIKALNALP